MSLKKGKVNITFDALWFKIFMDSDEQSLYDKEVFLTSGLSGNKDILMQMIGNVGGFARMENLDKDINVIVFSDSMLNQFKDNNVKDEFIQKVEDLINRSNTPYRKLIFTSEEMLIEYFTDRSIRRLKKDNEELKNKKNSQEVKELIKETIVEDKILADMVQKYKDSAIQMSQQTLF